MAKEKRLKIREGFELRCSVNSPLGEVISYLQKMPLNNLEMARGTLITRYLPFTLDLSKLEHRTTALACAIECESWGRAIREYCALPSASLSNPVPIPLASLSIPPSEENRSSLETEQVSESREEDELAKFRQMLQKIVNRSPSARDAKDRLIKLQPDNDESWSEAQWELWSELTAEQEAKVQKQLLGDWVS